MRRSRLSSGGKGINSAFKSPLLVHEPDANRPKEAPDLKQPEKTIADLKGKCQEMDSQIELLLSQGYSTLELDKHVEKLHEYNEIKDVTQIVFGQLAVLKGVTVKEIHESYSMDAPE